MNAPFTPLTVVAYCHSATAQVTYLGGTLVLGATLQLEIHCGNYLLLNPSHLLLLNPSYY